MSISVAVIGAGRTSRVVILSLARDDLNPEVEEILVADVDTSLAKKVAEEARGLSKSKNIEWREVDARDVDRTAELIAGYEVVMNCALFKVIPYVTRAALKAGVGYIDLGSDRETLQWQLSLSEEFRKRGITAVPGIGGSPGLVNVLARLTADRLDEVREIRMREGWVDFVDYESLGIPLPVPYSLETILDEFIYGGEIWVEGKTRPVPPMGGEEQYRFPEPIGVQTCYYVDHQETWSVGETFRDRGLKLVDYKLSFPRDLYLKYKLLAELGFASESEIELEGCMLSPLRVLRALVRETYKGKELLPNDVDAIVVEAKGSKGGKKCSARATAVARSWSNPPASAHGVIVAGPACTVAKWIALGRLSPGVLLPERDLDPELFLSEVSKYGVAVDLTVTTEEAKW